MGHDFLSFLDVYRAQGAVGARQIVDEWRGRGAINASQHGLMLSYIERRAGNIRGSIAVSSQAIEEGGESAALNISLAEDHIEIGEYAKAIEYCNLVIENRNIRIAVRFLSTALLLKACALIKEGEVEIAETILSILRPDFVVPFEGKFETVQALLQKIR